MNKEFIKAACIRAVKTMAQVAVSMITVGATMAEVNWSTIVSVSVVAGVTSLLTSIAGGIPEATKVKKV